MSTLSDIITQAFREGNFIAVGETPTAEEQTEALPRLRALLASLFGYEIGESYRDWYVPSSIVQSIPLRSPFTPADDITVSSADAWKYPPPNSRLLVKTTTAQTIYLPANPSDGSRIQLLNIGSSGALSVTIDGNGHLIENATTKTDTLTNLHGDRWFYRADMGDWVLLNIDALLAANDVPLPTEFDDLLVCGLAIRLSSRFQVSPDETTIARFTDMLRRLKKRYRQSESMPVSYGELSSTIDNAAAWEL